MVSKLCDAATLGSKIRDFECAAFCVLRFKAFVELAAICDSWLAKEDAMMNAVDELSRARHWRFLLSAVCITIDVFETFFLSLPLKSLYRSARLTLSSATRTTITCRLVKVHQIHIPLSLVRGV